MMESDWYAFPVLSDTDTVEEALRHPTHIIMKFPA